MDLTNYTDEELNELQHEIATELNNRLVFIQTKQNIAQLTQQYLEAGGTVDEVKAAVDEGELAKTKADKEKAKEEEEANNPVPVEPVNPAPVEPQIEPTPVEPDAPVVADPKVDPKPKV